MTGSSTLAVYGSLGRFVRDDSAATSIEYALIAAGVSIVILGAVSAVGANVTNMFSSVATALR
ncbi:MAG TPA: Flp family type IVb pilin [Xanthobacteraceae bacterium]|nr:Flp family type IVb pilin [Xanthobacteraceae bacterium]